MVTEKNISVNESKLLTRYLLSEIFRPFAGVLGIASALFCSYGAAEFLQDAANGMLAANMIGMIMLVKLIIALEVLAPVSLYLAIIMAFGKLYDGSELYVVPALRIAPAAVLKAALLAALMMGVIVAFISNVARPWAYIKLERLKLEATSGMDVGALIPGNFYTLDDGDRVIYLERKTVLGEEARGVYIFEKLGTSRIRVLASRKSFSVFNEDKIDKQMHGDWVQFQDAHMYEIGIFPHISDRIMEMRRGNRASVQEEPEEDPSGLPDFLEDSTWNLMTNPAGDRHRMVEAQWRCTTFVSTILLALLAVPLSRGNGPRQSKAGRLGIAIVIYFIYYMSYMTLRGWARSQTIPMFPGIWWGPIALALLTLILLLGYLADGSGISELKMVFGLSSFEKKFRKKS
ncbi:LptF/LptG family permease [Acetobacteraceae bacterium]|nr:LptF/LptG family permease [Acetobacteraceae bacterium]